MKETPQTLNAFDAKIAAGLAAALDSLPGRVVLEAQDLRDWREMSKFGETPNLAGVSLHPIARPAPGRWPGEVGGVFAGFGTVADGWKAETGRALDRALRSTSLVHVSGGLRRAGGGLFGVEFWLPGARADLAEGLRRMLHPAEGPAELSLLWWAEPLTDRRGAELRPALALDGGRARGAILSVDDPAWMAELLTVAAGETVAPEPFAEALAGPQDVAELAPDLPLGTLIWGGAADGDGRFLNVLPPDVCALPGR